MKAQMKMTVLVVLAMVGASAMADSIEHKASIRIDFNSMIEANNSESMALHKDVDLRAKAAAVEANAQAELTNVEVGWGEDAPVVDRRFDGASSAQDSGS